MNAVDAILATNPRYAGAAFHKPETEGAFIPMPNTGMVRIQQDAKLNAAKAIVAERLAKALEGLKDLQAYAADDRDFIQYMDDVHALTAWRGLVE